MSVGYRRRSAAPESAVKADKCAKSSSWNSGNARHWASLSLKGPVLLGISIDFNVRLLSLCCTCALLAISLLSATCACLSYVSLSSCVAAYSAVFSVYSFSICASFLSFPFCCLLFFSYLYSFPSSFLFGLIVFSFLSLSLFLLFLSTNARMVRFRSRRRGPHWPVRLPFGCIRGRCAVLPTSPLCLSALFLVLGMFCSALVALL